MGQCASLTITAVDPATASAEASKERLRKRTEQLSEQKKRAHSKKHQQQHRDSRSKIGHDSASSTLVECTSSFLTSSSANGPQRSSTASDPFHQRRVSSSRTDKNNMRQNDLALENSNQQPCVRPGKRQEEKRRHKNTKKVREERVQKDRSSRDNSVQETEPVTEESSTSNSTDEDAMLNHRQQEEDSSNTEQEEDDLATSIRSCRRSRRLSMELAALPNLSPMNVYGSSTNRKQKRFDSSWMGLSFSDHNKEEAKDSYRAQRTADGGSSCHSRASAITATEMSKSKQCALGNLLGGTPHYFTDAPNVSNGHNPVEEHDEIDDSMKDFGY